MTAELKYSRAQQFSAVASRMLSEFEASKLHHLVGDGRYSTHFWNMQINKNMPPEIMLNVGDAIHNWRSALDHCAYAFWLMDNSVLKTSKLREQEVYFPITTKRSEFRKKIRELGLYADAFNTFVNFDAYEGGRGDSLFRLSKLDNIDKHRLIPAANITVQISDIYVRSVKGSPFPYEQKLDPITINMSSNEMRTSLTNRMGIELFGYHNFEPIPAYLNRYIDDSRSKAKVEVQLAEHQPLLNHHCGPTLQGSLSAFSVAVSTVMHDLKTTLSQRLPEPI